MVVKKSAKTFILLLKDVTLTLTVPNELINFLQ